MGVDLGRRVVRLVAVEAVRRRAPLVLAGTWVDGISLVGDACVIPILVGHVLDDLRAAIGQSHLVAPFGDRPGALLGSVEVLARVVVLDAIREAVRPFL